MYHGERFNSITHLLGTVLAVSGSVVVIADAARGGDPWKIVSFSVFGTMLVVLYAASTLYHSISATRAKAVFRRLDHCRDLSADSRHLHAVYSCYLAWRAGLDTVRNDLDDGAIRHRARLAPPRR